MLTMRLGGDRAEADRLIDAIRGIGIEVQIDQVKDRGHIHQVYALTRMPDELAAAGEVPVRVRSRVGKPPAALPSGRRRLPGRRR